MPSLLVFAVSVQKRRRIYSVPAPHNFIERKIKFVVGTKKKKLESKKLDKFPNNRDLCSVAAMQDQIGEHSHKNSGLP
jgi:hypothetical protein